MIRCLIVEDSPSDLDRLCHFISASADPLMEVVAICDTTGAASAFIQEYAPDVIFLDRGLPCEIDGVEYLRILKKLNFGLPPVILTTADVPTASEVSKLQTIGKVLVLPKPYDEKDFGETIQALGPLSAHPNNRKETGADQFIQVNDTDNMKAPIQRMINVKDILFVASKGNLKCIRMNDGTEVFLWGNFSVFINYGFKLVHREFVVNFSSPSARFAYDSENRYLLVTRLNAVQERPYKLDVRANFTAKILLDYLNH